MSAMSLPANINKQLNQLIREGLTVEQACASLGLDVDAGSMALMTGTARTSRKEVSLAELIEATRPEAIHVLIEIMRCGERDADRVKAAQIILEGKGIMPEVNAAAATALLEKFNRMTANLSPVIDAVEVGRSEGEVVVMAK